MARKQGKNFFEAHWDWLVALGGILVAGASYVLNYQMASETKVPVMGAVSGDEVEAVDLAAPESALRRFENPARLKAIDAKGSFLASHARVFCTPADGSAGCGEVLLPDVDTCVNPLCKKEQKEEREKLVLDRDEDGFTDEYELANGLNPEVDDRDEDLDGDGFTNLEEFEAKTRPNDPLDHPDYLEAKDLIKVAREGKSIRSKLVFRQRGYEVPGKGHKFEFFHPDFQKEVCRGSFSVFKGEEIKSLADPKKPITTGFILEDYEQKSANKAMGGGMKNVKDVSIVWLKRIKDGERFAFRIGDKMTELDMKATITFTGVQGVEPFVRGKGEKIELAKYGVTYVVTKVAKATDDPNRLSVTLKDESSGKSKVVLSD